MNRRNFLRGLVGSAVALTAAPALIEEVARVYSFPTTIVIAQPALPMGYMQINLHSYLETYYSKKFVDTLKRQTAMDAMWTHKPLPVNSGRPLTMYVPYFAN